MRHESPFRISEGARRMIYFGVAAFPISILTCIAPQLEHTTGQRAMPYIFFGALFVFSILGVLAYSFTPKLLILPLGIIGWLVSASILCWYAWFGPGAFGHTISSW
jgi:hypothetical protein